MTVVVDTSAIMAVLLAEHDWARFSDALASNAGDLVISAVTFVETNIALEGRKGSGAVADFEILLSRLAVEVRTVTAAQAKSAFEAWRRFGKGRHPAKLNLGDCYAYALTQSLGARLLYKGNDFRQTDIPSVLD